MKEDSNCSPIGLLFVWKWNGEWIEGEWCRKSSESHLNKAFRWSSRRYRVHKLRNQLPMPFYQEWSRYARSRPVSDRTILLMLICCQPIPLRPQPKTHNN